MYRFFPTARAGGKKEVFCSSLSSFFVSLCLNDMRTYLIRSLGKRRTRVPLCRRFCIDRVPLCLLSHQFKKLQFPLILFSNTIYYSLTPPPTDGEEEKVIRYEWLHFLQQLGIQKKDASTESFGQRTLTIGESISVPTADLLFDWLRFDRISNTLLIHHKQSS